MHDPRLSSTGTVSCASCHNTMLGGEDNRPNSMGVNGRTSGAAVPTVWNSAFNTVHFWDGRAPSLEAQAAGPVTNPIEMGMQSWDDVVARLNAIEGYKLAFEKVFGKDSISKDNATKAIAAYERTLITPNSPYDKYVSGDKSALTEQQVRGMIWSKSWAVQVATVVRHLMERLCSRNFQFIAMHFMQQNTILKMTRG